MVLQLANNNHEPERVAQSCRESLKVWHTSSRIVLRCLVP